MQFGRAYDTAGSERIAFQPYAFYDIGRVWDLTRPNNAMSAASAGFGVRCRFYDRAQLDISLAKPLTRPAAVPKLGAYQNDTRFNISLQLTY